jgi:hypothetical protein
MVSFGSDQAMSWDYHRFYLQKWFFLTLARHFYGQNCPFKFFRFPQCISWPSSTTAAPVSLHGLGSGFEAITVENSLRVPPGAGNVS